MSTPAEAAVFLCVLRRRSRPLPPPDKLYLVLVLWQVVSRPQHFLLRGGGREAGGGLAGVRAHGGGRAAGRRGRAVGRVHAAAQAAAAAAGVAASSVEGAVGGGAAG